MSRISVITFKSFVLILMQAPVPKSKKDLAGELGIQLATVHKWIKVLHTKPTNLVYIAEWRRALISGPPTALWAWGYKNFDAFRPTALTRKEKYARYTRAAKSRVLSTGIIHIM